MDFSVGKNVACAYLPRALLQCVTFPLAQGHFPIRCPCATHFNALCWPHPQAMQTLLNYSLFILWWSPQQPGPNKSVWKIRMQNTFVFFFLGIVGTGLDFKLRQQWWTWWGQHYSKLERLWKTKHQLTSTALSKTAVMPNIIMSQQSVRKAHHFTILSWQYDPTLW